jgi:hypothetical protein
VSGPPNLSDRPLGKKASLEQVIWFLDRQLVPFVRSLRRILPEWLVPGDDGEVLKTEDGVPAWGQVTDENVSPTADVAVTKLAAGAAGEVLVTAVDTPEWAKLVNANVDAAAAVAVSKLAPGVNADVLTTVAGVPTWQAPASGGGSWFDLWEVDFTAEAAHTFVDGVAHAVQGVDVYSHNSFAPDVVKLDPGNGLWLESNAGTGGPILSGALSAYIDLNQFGPYKWLNGGPLRFQAQFEFPSLPIVDGQCLLMGIQPEFGSTGGTALLARVRQVAGTLEAGAGICVGAALSYAQELDDETLGANDTIEFRFEQPLSGEVAFTEYAGDWVDVDEPQGRLWSTGEGWPATRSAGVCNRDGSGSTVGGLRLWIGVNKNSSGVGGVSLIAYIKKIRVQQWRSGA